MAKSERDGSRVALEPEMTTNTPERPERIKRWGVISALPSEYLIVYRRGRLRERVSGQGGRCFKWPGDTVAIVPTTLKEVLFQANQITRDNVDVRIRGMVLYRISDPLRIYKLINFTNRQAAEAKLGRMIADICRSNAKTLVANMSLEQCLRQRKEEIASALKAEVAGVMSGEGQDLGVTIVTVDIQDIYIQDDQLFAALQAKFKTEREAEAQLAKLSTQQQVKRRELEIERQLEEERHRLTLDKARLGAEAERAGIAHQRTNDDDKFKLDRFRVEQNAAISLERGRREAEQRQLEAEAARERARIEAESAHIRGAEELALLRERLAAESGAGPASLERLFLTQVLPEVAKVMAQTAGKTNFTVFQSAGEEDGAATPFRFFLQQLLAVADRRWGAGKGEG